MAPTYITSHQFADMVNRKPNTIEHWRRDATGPTFTRINGRVMYDLEVVRAWLASRSHDSTAEYEKPTAAACARAAAIAHKRRSAQLAQSD